MPRTDVKLELQFKLILIGHSNGQASFSCTCIVITLLSDCDLTQGEFRPDEVLLCDAI